MFSHTILATKRYGNIPTGSPLMELRMQVG